MEESVLDRGQSNAVLEKTHLPDIKVLEKYELESHGNTEELNNLDYSVDEDKMTLAVTSEEEDSRDSINIFREDFKRDERKNEENIGKGNENVKIDGSFTRTDGKEDQNDALIRGVGIVSSLVVPVEEMSNSPISTNYKRKQSDSDWSSEEEDFAGFDDCNGDSSICHQHKKIKEEIVSDDEQNIKAALNTSETNRNLIKEENYEYSEQNKASDTLLHSPEIIRVESDQPNTLQPIRNLQLADTSIVIIPSNPTSSYKQKSVQDAIYKKPFEMGWKRELVYRAIPGISKDKGEVYYITPSGKKIRTRNDIQLNLTPGLTMDNFTFAKEPIGVGPDEELIRIAKPSSRSTSIDITLGKRIPKPKGPKGASPPPQGWTPVRAVKSSNSSPRPVNASRISEDVDSRGSSTTLKPTKSGKVQKKNTSANSALTTGDDVPVRKRVQNARTSRVIENTAENAQLQPSQQKSTAVNLISEHFSANFFGNVSIGYHILLQTFQYLKVQELLRAACVCRVWNVVANHRSLWKTVRMKNSQVNDWTGLAAALRRNETKHLDLRKMLISSTNGDEMWLSFSKNIRTVVSLETIDLCRCSSKIVENLFKTNSNLRILNAVTIKDDLLNLENIRTLDNLQELRLKSIDGCSLEGDLLPLERLKHIRHLSLTSFRDLGTKEIQCLGELDLLESLELGECSELNLSFAKDVLSKLVHLERLRLEKGQDNCCTLEILDSLAELYSLAQLELVNFDIKSGFDDKLSRCKNLKRLLLIPTYISQSATTNHIILSAVLQLSETLQTLTWAVTLELLRVTALYVDQCDNKKKDKKFFDESIPVLKPVPGIQDDTDKVQKTPSDVPQVEILPLIRVEKILINGMPKTKFKILKVPYHATWRQNLVDIQ